MSLFLVARYCAGTRDRDLRDREGQTAA